MQKKFFYYLALNTVIIFTALQTAGCAGGIFAGTTATGAAIGPDRRTLGTMIDDTSGQLKAQIQLNKDKFLTEKTHIATLSYNNSLLLVGQVPNNHMRSKAFDIVSRVPSISRIYNEIEIAKPTPLSQRTKDSWITTRVKFKLLTAKEVGPGRISVITENGVVYLMGMVSPEEAYASSELARAIPGVKRVVKVFDPIEDHNQSPTS